MDAHLTLKRRDLPRPRITASRMATTRLATAATLYSVGTALLLLTASLFAWRRMDGALSTPLDAASLLLAATCLSAASLAMFRAVRTWQSQSPRSVRFGLVAATSAAVILIASSLSLPGTSAWGLTALWLPITLSLVGQSLPIAWRGNKSSPASGGVREQSSTAPSSAPILRVDGPHTSAVTGPHFPPEHVTQQLTRSITEDGLDQYKGWIRASFDEGQRQQVVHLAFCPPFQTLPELSTTLADGQAVEIKHAQLMPYGARVELKRDRSEKSPSVALLRFSAVEVRAAS